MEQRTAPQCGCVTTGKIIRGMCATHYDRWVHATPKEKRGPTPRFSRDFWDFVDKSGDCWVWTGPTNRKGYGWWSGNGTRGLAHRLSLSMHDPLPSEALMACHHCDNPPCVNPAHLYWGTARDNADDMVERSRGRNANSLKTHCKNGHELIGDNLRVVGKDQRRQCRICDNERSRLKMAARRARERSSV